MSLHRRPHIPVLRLHQKLGKDILQRRRRCARLLVSLPVRVLALSTRRACSVPAARAALEPRALLATVRAALRARRHRRSRAPRQNPYPPASSLAASVFWAVQQGTIPAQTFSLSKNPCTVPAPAASPSFQKSILKLRYVSGCGAVESTGVESKINRVRLGTPTAPTLRRGVGRLAGRAWRTHMVTIECACHIF